MCLQSLCFDTFLVVGLRCVNQTLQQSERQRPRVRNRADIPERVAHTQTDLDDWSLRSDVWNNHI